MSRCSRSRASSRPRMPRRSMPAGRGRRGLRGERRCRGSRARRHPYADRGEARRADRPVAGRLHTARSRNDQVATDFRLWVRDAIDQVLGALAALTDRLADPRRGACRCVMPGFTHLQSAQPVTLGHHLMAYVEMIARDVSRFRDARARMNLCPLGSAALAGTSFPLDRAMTAAALGFDGPTRNSLDAVSDATSRSTISRGDTDRAASVAARRGIRAVGVAAVRLRRPVGPMVDGQLDHAAEAQSRCRRAGARPCRADHGLHDQPDGDDEGSAARLFEGHAGRQAAGVRMP